MDKFRCWDIHKPWLPTTPPTSGRLGGLSTPIRPIPQCRASLISELLPNLLTLQPPTCCEICQPGTPRAWPASYHELGPAINGSTHSSDVWHMCVTSSPIGLHQRHPRRLPPSGPGDKMKQCTLRAMFEHLRPWTLRVSLTSPKSEL